MYIVSKFNDYYDSASSFGIDKTCVYDRKKQLLKEKLFKNIKRHEKPKLYYKDLNHKKLIRLDQFIIYFCGQSFSVLRLVSLSEQDRFFYSHDEFNQYLKEKNIEVELDPFNLFRLRYKEAFDTEKFDKELKNLFHKYKMPVFVYGDFDSSPFYDLNQEVVKPNIYLNPQLEYFQFYRVKDSFTAFQEIYQFMAGYLGTNEVDTIDIDDESKAKQRGFFEYSFKTTPGSKKPRRKAKCNES